MISNVKIKTVKRDVGLSKENMYLYIIYNYCWIHYDCGMRNSIAKEIIEPRFIQSHWFHMLAPLSTWPQQRMCVSDETQLSKARVKLCYHKFLARLPQTT